MWLKEPLAAPDLPRKHIIADCYAALRPDAALWGRYLDEIDRLQHQGEVEEEDVQLLRFSLDAQRALMGRTRGDPDEVSNEAIADVLEVARAQARAPVEEKLAKVKGELADERALREEAERKATAEADAARAAEEDARQHAVAADAAREAVRLSDERQRGRIERRAHRHARVVGHVLFGVLMLALGAAAVLSAAALTVPSFSIPGGPLAPVAASVLLGVSTFTNWVWGWNLRAGIGRLESWLKGVLTRRYLVDFDGEGAAPGVRSENSE